MQGSILKFPVSAPEGVLWACEGAAVSFPQCGLETMQLVQFKPEEEDQMKRWTLSMMCVVILFGIGLPVSLAMANEANRLSVSVAFGLGLNTAQPGNPVNHVILPNKIKIKQDGVMHFLVAGFHQVLVYKPGTKPEDVRAFIGNSTATFIHDQDSLSVNPQDLPNNLFYAGINPGGGPLATPGTILPFSNSQNRVESVGFPDSEGVGTNGVASLKAESGVYLVVCNVRGHFLDGMYAFVKVKAVKAEEEEDD
jgi:hypothetical protein